MNFLSDLFGPYPFDSTGAVADRASGVGYALEVQTKPHYAGGFTSGNPSINIGTQLHELAHQWVGNSVTLAQWDDIWFNEGWANWAEWQWQFAENGGDDPAAIFDDLYDSTPPEDWAIAPAVLDGDPANLFLSFPTYDRGAMTHPGLPRDRRRRDVLPLRPAHDAPSRARQHLDRRAHRGRRALVGTGRERTSPCSRDYFQQWLYGTTKPTLLPEAFTS